RFRVPDARPRTEWGDEVVTPYDAMMLMATGEASAAEPSDLQLSIVELARQLTVNKANPEAVILDRVRPMRTEHDAAVYVREAAAKIRAPLRARAPLPAHAAAALSKQPGTAGARATLHITQDDAGYWMLSIEQPEGGLALVAHQFATPAKPLEVANEMIR